MRHLMHFALGLAALFPASTALANDTDRAVNLRIDVVVDMTEAGKKVPRPTPEVRLIIFL